MFISLKWRAVVFITVMTVIITVAWSVQTVLRQLDAFDQELTYHYETQTALLDELFDDTYLKLSQIAQVISSNQSAFVEPENESQFKAVNSVFEQKWLSINLLLELDYMAFFDEDNLVIVEGAPSGLAIDDHFFDQLQEQLEISAANDEPSYFVYCSKACVMAVLEPFINDKGEYNTFVLVQNLSDLVRIFFNLSKSSLSILLEGDEDQSSRRLPNWQMHAWAVSDFSNIYPVVESYSSEVRLGDSHTDRVFKYQESAYLIKELEKPRLIFAGQTVHFISVTDKTAAYDAMVNSIIRGALIATTVMLLIELFLVWLVSRLLNKLKRVSDALLLLPKQEFDQAITMVRSDELLLEDELTSLEKSTASVAGELKDLHQEVYLKNESLNEQVAALTRSRGFLTRLFDNSDVFIVTQDAGYSIQSTNRKFDELYDFAPETYSALIRDADEYEDFQLKVCELFDGLIASFHQELTLIDKQGKSVIVAWTHTLVEDEQGHEIILSIGMDQTQQKSAESDLRWMANHDSLTGIGNRRSFNSAFKDLLGSRSTGAVVFIDVNRFKHINDIYGHNIGDQVLVNIANKLRVLVRNTDTISRFAGDEFTVLLDRMTLKTLPDVLQKLASELSDFITSDAGQVIHYSVSIGAALFPDHGNDSESLLVNADMAMYQAKKKGMGYWHIYDAADARVDQIKHDHNMILVIKAALERNGFKLVYQPIVNLESNDVSHFEALVRMYDLTGKVVAPGQFIPLAERSGLIRKIDEWVLSQAVLELSEWSVKGCCYSVAVNISAPTLQAHSFPEIVETALQKYQINPSQLVIELTETAYIENFQQVLKNLKSITQIGVRVALDDFGVGFSSFTYLKMLPLSFVKLDGSYIKNINQNSDDQVFVKSLAAMINAFGMKTVAEFVEDQSTLAAIQSLGVTHGQGYYWGKPAAMGELEAEFRNQTVQ